MQIAQKDQQIENLSKDQVQKKDKLEKLQKELNTFKSTHD
jgi:hypothetical protein